MYRILNHGEMILNKLRNRKRNSNATSHEGQCQKPANAINMVQRREEDCLEREEKQEKRK